MGPIPKRMGMSCLESLVIINLPGEYVQSNKVMMNDVS